MSIDTGFLKYICQRLITRRQYTKRDFFVLFIVATTIGAGIKFVATQTITIGFDDYTLTSAVVPYDVNTIQRQLIEKNNFSTPSDAIVAGAMCKK